MDNCGFEFLLAAVGTLLQLAQLAGKPGSLPSHYFDLELYFTVRYYNNICQSADATPAHTATNAYHTLEDSDRILKRVLKRPVSDRISYLKTICQQVSEFFSHTLEDSW